uniref:G_PROTEIN_RECEP_F1_2 domain-containing protein n=1 Tax=Rhabditophanes sp. KR3021 TaxID=114890 RepID=A0AC35TWM4_9BILA
MAEFNLEVSELSKNYLYELIWRIGFRNLITVILPFFVLVIINGRVIYILATSPDSTTTTNTSTDFMTTEYQRKLRVRVATKTLLCVVFTYLLSNLLNVIITFWEYIDMYTLQFVHVQFYTFAVDLVSISTVLAGMFRLPIYASCMPELRKEFRTYFHKLLHPDEYETMLMIKKKPNFLKRLVMSDHKGKDVFLSIGTMLIVKHKNSYDTQSLKDTESEGEETSIDENQNCIPPIGSITEMPSNQITNPPPQVSNSSCLTLFTGIISNNNSKDDDDEIFL